MAEAFNEQQFRDVFTVTQKIKTKLQPFIVKYKEHNMTWIMRSFEQLHRMFFDNKIDIVQRFNSIFGIKFIFDTGEVILINLIEIYFLPKILQIASYDLQGPDDKRGITYFLNNGYSNQTPNVEKFGYNYVRMASEFIFSSAVVKPNRLFDNQPYNQPSEYSLALKKLQDGGWKMYASPAYYKEGVVQPLKALFDKSLEQVEDVSQLYIEYFSAIFKKFIIDEKPFQSRLDPKKMLQFGDTYITPNVIGVCADYLRSNNFRAKKTSLYLLNYLIKWGDIEATHEVNCTNLLDELLYEVANPEVNSKILARGKTLFKKSKANEQEKQQLYNQLLKDIQFWSLCHPNGIKNKNRQSKIKMVHDQFRSKLQLQFPVNKDLKQDKAIFDEQIKKNKMRNSFLLKQLKETDPQPQSYVIIKKTQEIQEPTPSGGNTYNDLLKEMNEIQQYLGTLCQNKGKVDAKINKILVFQQIFQPKIQQAEIDDDQLNEIFTKWDDLLKKINKMVPVLKQYQNHQITFQQLSEAFSNKKSPKKQAQPKKEQKMPKQEEPPASTKKEVPPSSKKQVPVQSKKQVSIQVKKQVQAQVKKEKAPQNPKTVNKQKQPASLPTILRMQSQLKGQSLQMAQTLNKQPAYVAQTGKKLAEPSIKAAVQQMTPIKTMVQSPIKQKDDHGMSVLPQISKKSIEKEHYQSSLKSGTIQKEKISFAQAIDIKPASHTIIKDEEEKITQVLFKQTQSSKKVYNSIKSVEKEVVREVQVHQPFRKQELQFNQNTNNHIFQQSQHFEGIKVPRSLKNVTGSNRIEQYNPYTPSSIKQVAAQAEVNLLKQSRASSRRSQKMKFQESKISVQMEREDESDLIMMPDNNPLERSYHELGGVEDFIKQSTALSFKKCFEDDKYLFGSERNNKKFWLANETVSLIKPAGAPRKQSRNKDSSVSIPQILNERNKKYQQQLKYVQEKKDRKINELQSKIKQLQNNGKILTSKLYEQEKEIKQIRASSQADNSRIKKNSILQDQDHIFKAKMATFQNNKSIKQKSFYDDSSRKQPKYLDPLGKIVNIRKYSTYFQQFETQKQRKNLLKNKELLLKNDQIEFGCMTKREKESLVITFYITPSYDLDGLVSRVSINDNLQIEVQPKGIPSIRKGKQEKVIVTVNIIDIPYTLPTIEFSYSLASKLETQKFLIPCSFHKFIYLNAVTQKELSRQFEKKSKILRGQQVPYSKKLIKSFDNLSDYFPNGTLLNGGYPNDNGQVQYGGRADWKGDQFWVRVMVKQSQFMYVQTVAEQNGVLQEFYLSLITNLLMKNIELKEM